MPDIETPFMARSDDLEVIVKVTEVCNINCSYCYVFNKGNDDFASRPQFISTQTVDAIVAFLTRGVDDLRAKRMRIVLHGGEPLMLGKRRFRALCQSLRDGLGEKVDLGLGMQTNGALIDPEWIDIFEEFSISIGVSLDGPAHVHDHYRVDKAGRGTHAQTLAGIELLRHAHNQKRIGRPGAICVINPDFSASDVYSHIVRELGFKRVSFNLPMETCDSVPVHYAQALPRYLTELFDEWISDADPQIDIRIFDQMMRFFAGHEAFQQRLLNMHKEHLMVVIAADGDLSEHDDFKVINFAQRMGNVKDTSLLEFANQPLRSFLHSLINSVPDGCKSCDWRNYCRAGCTHGLAITRYSEENGFNNRSSLCAGFEALFQSGADFLQQNGLPQEQLRQALGLDGTDDRFEDCNVPMPEVSFYTRQMEQV